MEWQPIETAPKDGTVVLLWTGEPITGFWRERYGWCDNARESLWGFDAIYWAPIQPPAHGIRSTGGEHGN